MVAALSPIIPEVNELWLSSSIGSFSVLLILMGPVLQFLSAELVTRPTGVLTELGLTTSWIEEVNSSS